MSLSILPPPSNSKRSYFLSSEVRYDSAKSKSISRDVIITGNRCIAFKEESNRKQLYSIAALDHAKLKSEIPLLRRS